MRKFAENLEILGLNLQRYNAGQHFQSIHTGRSSLAILHRVFALITYKNDADVEEGATQEKAHADSANRLDPRPLR